MNKAMTHITQNINNIGIIFTNHGHWSSAHGYDSWCIILCSILHLHAAQNGLLLFLSMKENICQTLQNQISGKY